MLLVMILKVWAALSEDLTFTPCKKNIRNEYAWLENVLHKQENVQMLKISSSGGPVISLTFTRKHKAYQCMHVYRQN